MILPLWARLPRSSSLFIYSTGTEPSPRWSSSFAPHSMRVAPERNGLRVTESTESFIEVSRGC
ncbi:hypothetical protein B0H10DRAFT_2077074 [Mycena sp. CBHHK59/15]|nr:hypothetical protein B0H10DRAFT_2077074 [Mycena sp. CBHHK59/15]